jgi:hypothetical protein
MADTGSKTILFLLSVFISLWIAPLVTLAADPEVIAPSSVSDPAVYLYPASGVKIGEGWNSLREGGTAATCVTVDEQPLEQSSYQTSVEQIQSTYSLATKVTTSVSASYKGFGIGASASANSGSQSTISLDGQNFLFTFKGEYQSTFGAPPTITSDPLQPPPDKGEKPTTYSGKRITLTDDAANLLKSDPVTFRLAYGDGFVSAIHRGARIFVLLTQKYALEQSQESLAATLNASGWGASANASYSTSTTKLNSTDSLV